MIRSRSFTCAFFILALASPLRSDDSPDALDEAHAWFEAGRYRAAEERARRLLAAAEVGARPDSAYLADVLNVLVESLCHGGKAASAESEALGKRALEIRQRIFGPDSAEAAESLHTLACLAWMTGDYERADVLIERVLEIRRRALGGEPTEVAETLSNLALLKKTLGRFDIARDLYEEALAMHEKNLGHEHFLVAGTLTNLAVLLRVMGEYEAARPLFERALAIREKTLGPTHPEVAFSLNSLARLLQIRGDYSGARALFERALQIREAALGSAHPDVAVSLSNLALIAKAMGDYAESRNLIERALEIQQRLTPEHPDVAIGLNNLAILARLAGRMEEARPLAERALEVALKTLGPEHRESARIMNNLGRQVANQGERARARQLFESALAAREKIFGGAHPDVAESLLDLARWHRDRGASDGGPSRVALMLFERAVTIRRASFGEDHPAVAAALADLALAHWYLGSPRLALEAALRAEDIGRDHLRLTIRTLSEHRSLLYAETRPGGLDLGLTIAARGGLDAAAPQVWNALVRRRALVLDEMAERHRVLWGAEHPELRELWDEWRSTGQRLANLSVRGPQALSPERHLQLLARTRQEKDRIELALARKSSSFGDRQRRGQVNLDDVAAALPLGSVSPRGDRALLAYVHYERKIAPSPEHHGPLSVPSYLAFLLPKGGLPPRVVDLGPAAEIDVLVKRWRVELSRYSEKRYRAAGERLRQAVWDPIRQHLGDARQIFIVPDGALHLVSFAALPVGESEYLVEQDLVIHYLSAERDLAMLTAPVPKKPGLLALGGPAFGTFDPPGAAARGSGAACDAFSGHPFVALPAAAAEAEEIAAIWQDRPPAEATGQVLRLIGAEASEEAFTRQASGFGVLHLATHGFFLREPCSAGPADEPAGLPLRLSGLALAGANQHRQARPDEEDGILTAQEIAALDLSGAEWAVLSACDTGSGEIRADEGVFGLRRSFRIAGVRTLILSLWKLDDEAAREWMQALYAARWSRGLPTAEAVREAGREVLGRYRARGRSGHPRFWGAMVAEGDWR